MRPSPTIPDAQALAAVQRLCDLPDPYPSDRQDDLFLEAMNQSILWHYKRNAFYRAFLDAKRIRPWRNSGWLSPNQAAGDWAA